METILVVDDDADIRLCVQWMLERAGYRVLTAGDGSEVEEAINRHHIDVVLLDLQMPGMNGWEVMRGLKERERRPPPGTKAACRPKVIVVSGRDEPETVAFVRHLGADAYGVKPLTAEQVIALVRGVMATQPSVR